MQQSLSGCVFCDTPPGINDGTAQTWGTDEVVTHPICPACARQATPAPEDLDQYACDGCGLVVDALPALTSFRVQLGHLEGTVRFCARCTPDGPATYWTRDLEPHIVE